MAKKYLTTLDSSAFVIKLKSIIENLSEDTFATHCNHIFKLKNDGKTSGNVHNNIYKVWAVDAGSMGVTGPFYPVIQLNFLKKNGLSTVVIKSKINVVGKTIYLSYLLITVGGIIDRIIIQENNELRFIIARILVSSVLLCLLMSLPTYMYLRTRRIVIKYLKYELHLKDI